MGYAKHSESYRVRSMESGRVNEVLSVHFYEDLAILRRYVERVLSNRSIPGNRRTLGPTTIPFSFYRWFLARVPHHHSMTLFPSASVATVFSLFSAWCANSSGFLRCTWRLTVD